MSTPTAPTNPLMARFTGASAMALIAPEAQAQFEICLTQTHLAMLETKFAQAVAQAAAAGDDFWSFEPGSYLDYLRPYVVKNGILQIPVKGVLLHDFPYALGNWATGYDYIWQAFKRGMADPEVQGIALICNTPGGMVAGCFEAVDRMFALKNEVKKPVRGYASESAYSAGYAIISVCDVINVSRTGGVGSIGVVTGHLDMSEYMAKAGFKFTYVFAGKHKVDGNPYSALPDDVKARMQTRIDELYEVFVSTVARNRPALSEAEARATEALCFTATEAVSNRLADKIGALDDSLAEFAADLQSTEGNDTMSTTDGSVTKADHETAVAAARTEGATAGRAEGIEQGRKEGATAERTRISTILGSEEAKTRPVAAMTTAMETGMSVEDAATFLGKLKEEKAEAPAAPAAGSGDTPFDAAMDASGNPNIRVEGGGEDTAQGKVDDVLSLVRSQGLAGFNDQPQK